MAGHEAEWTFINSGDPVNDVHLTPRGYEAVSDELIATVAIPAPPAVVLLVVGIGALGAVRLRWARVR